MLSIVESKKEHFAVKSKLTTRLELIEEQSKKEHFAVKSKPYAYCVGHKLKSKKEHFAVKSKRRTQPSMTRR